MGLNPLATATAGLRATQAAIGLVSQNVANAGTAGYVRRTLTSVASGSGNAGVATGTITRSFDTASLKQLRLETSGSGYTATKSGVLSQLDKLYGTPGSATALDGILNTFTQSLQTLAANPSSAAARSTVLSSASTLAGKIGSIAGSVQDIRSGIESRLGTETKDASALLAGIASLNVKIQNTSDDGSRADLLDQRDQKVNQLAGYFDIQTQEQRDGTLTVMTGSGVTLVDRGSAASLSFDGRSTLGPNATYSTDADKRGVGTITATTPGGGRIDLGEPGVLRSGTIAAEFELRDTILPQAQRQLDDLASGLATSLTDRTVTGTVSGTGASLDIAGIQAGNRLTVPVKGPGGSVRNVVLIASNGPTQGVDPGRTDDGSGFAQTFDISGGPATYGPKLQEALTAMASRLSTAGYPSVPALTAGGTGSTVTIAGTGGW
ncbi:flagellar hook-associated protein FlgK, partial [Methylobacterium trifolii]